MIERRATQEASRQALADAFAKLYGWLDPTSQSYRLRNPGMLRC